MKKFGLTVAAVGLIAALGACTGKGFPTFIGTYVSEDIAAAKALRCKGSAFNQALLKEYIALAEVAIAESDHQHAEIYIQKGIAACEDREVHTFGGQKVVPEVLGMWWIPADEDAQLIKARAELMPLLDGNGRTRAPAVAARAQAMFDCWVEEAHEDYWMRQPGVMVYQPEDLKRCKDGFFAALAELKGVGKAEKFIIFFAFDKSNIDAEAAAVLNRVTDAAKRREPARIAIFGFTDTAGSASYNVGLSKRRAQAVVRYLTQRGVGATRISATGLGETQLRVPTADGVPERQNRRAEITIR
ncbi:MAG: OmpA family protein [Alphaproteobacteria bacterium]|nr:OmpA family protein [Alphaproteobacteria bacterium]